MGSHVYLCLKSRYYNFIWKLKRCYEHNRTFCKYNGQSVVTVCSCPFQVNKGCADIQQTFCEALTEEGDEHHTVCHCRHFVVLDNGVQVQNPERSWQTFKVEINVAVQRKQNHRLAGRTSGFDWVEIQRWLCRTHNTTSLKQASASVNCTPLYTWLCV